MHAITATRRVVLSLAALAGAAASAQAQKTHEVRLEADRDKDVYRFTPQKVTVSPGDVVVFKAVSGAPHGIVFEGKDLTPAGRKALSNALGAQPGELGAPMITKSGAAYRLVIPKLPPGTYPYFCLPHRAYDMRGEIVVKKE